jgi:hypothetical protein
MFLHYIDILPFVIALGILLIGPSYITPERPLSILVVLTSAVFILAQSSWFTAFINGDEWGRDWANLVWFFFNSLTMVIFVCIIRSNSCQK